jgi:hypothetical protein
MTERIIDALDPLDAQLDSTPVEQESNPTNCQPEPTQQITATALRRAGAIEIVREEFRASAIADDIADLNFRTWNPLDENDLDEVFTLLVPEPEHRNNGTLAGRSQNDLANTLRGGGWIFEGHQGVCVKPDSSMSLPGVQGINSYLSPTSRFALPMKSWENLGLCANIPNYSHQLI